MKKVSRMEIERKFLVERPSESRLMQYATGRSTIVQTYLVDDGSGGERRLRQRSGDGGWRLYLTEKFATASAVERAEYEQEISPDDYIELMAQADIERGQLVKERWVIPWAGYDFELDTYPFSEDLAIMEVELPDADAEIILPEFIGMIREVTEDMAYRNSSLAETRRL